jgi:polysaccharide deacetylase family protein (PEP-CTERM system associated)
MPNLLLTVDVEDWFQVENLRGHCPPHTWDSFELRVERNTHRILDLLDSIEVAPVQQGSQKADQNIHESPSGSSLSRLATRNPQPGASVSAPSASTSRLHAPCQMPSPPATRNPEPVTRNPKSTFFILGWLAKRLPQLVQEIQARGHEVASHGENHLLCSSQSDSELLADLESSKKCLEDIISQTVNGYRAPSFSISRETLELIRQAGYIYDSSFNSFAGHGRYGTVDLSGYSKNGSEAIQLADDFFELPISNLRLGGRTIPWGGGGYFRLLPLPVYQAGLKRALSRQDAFIFYMHPWEIDPQQPRVGISGLNRFKHYVNLDRMEAKVRRLLQENAHLSFPTCSDYLCKTEYSVQE